VVHHKVLGLSGFVKGNGDNNFEVHTADLGGVVLKEAVVAARARVAEILMLIQFAGADHD
jgi:hypothetical protein